MQMVPMHVLILLAVGVVLICDFHTFVIMFINRSHTRTACFESEMDTVQCM